MFRNTPLWLCVACFALLANLITAQPSVDGIKSFSSAIKGGHLEPNKEKTLFKTTNGPGYFTEMWFTGALDSESTVIRIYMDGNMTDPALEFNLYLAHGIGCQGAQEKTQTPWHTAHFGHEAENGGLYNTYRIPFGADGAVVTAENPKGGTFWYIVRGLMHAPLVVDGFTLPDKTRLRLYKNNNASVDPLQFLTLAEVQDYGGWIYQVTLGANSSTFNYLEACFRLSIDNGETQFLSSGTEDFFLSAYYFNRGVFHADQSGLSCKVGPGQMGAYKFFASDPLFFSKSVLLRWRCGETSGGANGCPNDVTTSNNNARYRRDVDNLNVTAPQQTIVSTYVWIYEYQASP